LFAKRLKISVCPVDVVWIEKSISRQPVRNKHVHALGWRSLVGKVRHAERIKAERIFGREYEVWDVHTNESRWWVITPFVFDVLARMNRAWQRK
jgi:hypothetical protein